MTISEALAVYLLQLRADGRSEHSVRQYQRHVRLLTCVLGDVEIGAITHIGLAQFLVSAVVTHSANGTPKKATTVNAIRSSLRTAFRWWHNAGLIPSNPARLVRLARCGSPPPRSLSEDEQQRLLGVLASATGWEAERDRALFGLMLATGIRLASALAIDVADVDLPRGEILLRTAKGDRPRKVFLGAAALAHLLLYIRPRSKGPLFPSRQGRALSSRQAQRRLADWFATADIGHGSPHSLRHSFGMRIYHATHDVLLVQRALGHRSISSTVAYARSSDDELRAAVNEIGARACDQLMLHEQRTPPSARSAVVARG